jgi:hypothetical protein
MRLSAKALAITSGLIWGCCLLLVGLITLAAPSYGTDFLRGTGSIYPGFFHVRNFADVLLGTVYGFVDGVVAGWLMGWLYNSLIRPTQQSAATRMDRAA